MKNKKSKIKKNYAVFAILCVIAIITVGIAVAMGISNQESNKKDTDAKLEITAEDGKETDSDKVTDAQTDVPSDEETSVQTEEPSNEETDTQTEGVSNEEADIQTEVPSDEETSGNVTDTPDTPTDTPVDTPVSQSVEERAKDIVSTMSIEEKVGQMFISRCPEGTGVSEARKYHLGGYILFARDFENESPDSMKKTIDSYQNSGKIPMLMGVDEEGGTVVRVSRYPQFRSSRFDSPMNIYQAGGFSALGQDSAEKSQLLSNLGINMNFAPVCDLPDTEDAFMYDRSFGLDVNVAVEGVVTIVNQMKKDNMLSVLKHFPGYGNNVDTHTGVAVDERDIEEFRKNDFKPFQAGIDAGAPCVMVSHNIINCMDSSSPASLSLAVHEVLRNELGFQGVIVTDDLSMDAITTFAGAGQAAVMAVQAGNDLLCVSDYAAQVPAVVDAVRSGKISEERINESVCRILVMKMNYGIID